MIIKNKLLNTSLTESIIKSFYCVYNTLGFGFLEKVYENSMIIELNKAGLDTLQQGKIIVEYENKVVGNYFADIIVNRKIILELKAAESIKKEHEIQLLNYLKATKFEIGLLFNFGKKPEFKRFIYSNKNP
ncbi:MAG: GxxExxY protein [Spirochaetes bacterium]|nr:GxxExxY protein [Spirochaetota bacterium]